MPVLHIGVNEVPYAWGKRSLTTYDVARFLEARYHVFEFFARFNMPFIHSAVVNSAMGSMETALMGGPGGRQRAYAQATADIEDRFKQAISLREFDGRIPGVPTKASLRGVDHRKKNPYAKRGPRPSFRDTSTLQTNLRAWVELDSP